MSQRSCFSVIPKASGFVDRYVPNDFEGREPPRSVASTYRSDRNRRRSRSPDRRGDAPSNCYENDARGDRPRHPRSSIRGPSGGGRSMTSSCRTRSPSGNGRKLVSYADVDCPDNRYTPSTASTKCESRGLNAHIAKPSSASMEASDSSQYYEFAKKEYALGTIIRAPVHQEDVNRTPRSYAMSGMSEYQASRIRSHVSHTPHGAVYSESRFLIVVERFATTYMAIPLFTHQGTSLRFKPDRNEYVSIQDNRHPGTSTNEAPHTLLTEYLASSVQALKPTSVAHLRAPVSRSYKLHVRYQGKLTKAATDLMLKLYHSRGD